MALTRIRDTQVIRVDLRDTSVIQVMDIQAIRDIRAVLVTQVVLRIRLLTQVSLIRRQVTDRFSAVLLMLDGKSTQAATFHAASALDGTVSV
jgi:hypothetical protein